MPSIYAQAHFLLSLTACSLDNSVTETDKAKKITLGGMACGQLPGSPPGQIEKIQKKVTNILVQGLAEEKFAHIDMKAVPTLENRTLTYINPDTIDGKYFMYLVVDNLQPASAPRSCPSGQAYKGWIAPLPHIMRSFSGSRLNITYISVYEIEVCKNTDMEINIIAKTDTQTLQQNYTDKLVCEDI